MSKLPELADEGDNFRRLGPWRILEGEAWRRWRVAAAEAELRAAQDAGDDPVARRLQRRRDGLQRSDPQAGD